MPYAWSLGNDASSSGVAYCYPGVSFSPTSTAAGSTSAGGSYLYIPFAISSISAAEELEKVRLEKELAIRAAEEMLAHCLGEERLKEYKHSGQISVESPSKPGRRYVVSPTGKIKVYEGEQLVDELCAGLVDPSGARDSNWLPEPDVVLGKVWLLENDEERLLATANHNPVRMV